MKTETEQHTDGPWTADKDRSGHWLVCDPYGHTAQVFGDDAEAGANARLIAAAPELLEALRGLLANAPAPKRIKDDFSYILYLEAARTALAKAEGK
jgi:hypothetical protein